MNKFTENKPIGFNESNTPETLLRRSITDQQLKICIQELITLRQSGTLIMGIVRDHILPQACVMYKTKRLQEGTHFKYSIEDRNVIENNNVAFKGVDPNEIDLSDVYPKVINALEEEALLRYSKL